MAGDPAQAELWPDADVYVAFDLDADIPADESEEFGAGWDLVGLLDGDQGFAYGREQDVNDRFAWGGIIVRTTRKNFKQTVKWTALERNESTRRLAYPGSTPGLIVVPKPEFHLIAFETREDDKVKRLISKYRAQTDLDADIEDKEDELTKYAFVTTVFPNADGELFVEQPEVGS